MPQQNRKGPEGKGPKTGRGMGLCNPQKQKNDEHVNSNDAGKHLGKGAGMGLGRRCRKGIGGIFGGNRT